MKKKQIIKICLFLTFFCLSNRALAESPFINLPKEIQVEHLIWKDILVQQEGVYYCRLNLPNEYGKIQNLTSNSFEFAWEKWDKEHFKKKGKNTYVQEDVKQDLTYPLPAPSLPNRPNKTVFINGKRYLLFQDAQGRCFDQAGNYMGKILAENEIKKIQNLYKESKNDKKTRKSNQENSVIEDENKRLQSVDEEGKLIKRNLIFLDKNNQKQIFEQSNNQDYYVLSKYQVNSFKQNRFLLFMPSFKRPIFLSGQILRMMNQTYKNFKLSVSIKGVSEEIVQKILMPEWDPFIHHNQLLIQFDSNKNQFSNALDPIRNVDISEYDYFCKIDDDDWYAPRYLEDINEHLNTHPNIAYSDTRTYYIVSDTLHSAKFDYSTSWWEGPTLCVSQSAIKKIFELEKMSDYVRKEKYPFLADFGYFISQHEDALFSIVAAQTGVLQKRIYSIPTVLYGNQYPSVTRNQGYVELQSTPYKE